MLTSNTKVLLLIDKVLNYEHCWIQKKKTEREKMIVVLENQPNSNK